jgi:hypothetical protein
MEKRIARRRLSTRDFLCEIEIVRSVLVHGTVVHAAVTLDAFLKLLIPKVFPLPGRHVEHSLEEYGLSRVLANPLLGASRVRFRQGCHGLEPLHDDTRHPLFFGIFLLTSADAIPTMDALRLIDLNPIYPEQIVRFLGTCVLVHCHTRAVSTSRAFVQINVARFLKYLDPKITGLS